MTQLEQYRKVVVGKTLTNLFFTKQDGPHDCMPGISPAYYFSTIMELDGFKKFRFADNFIVDWNNEEPLFTLTNHNWSLPESLVFKQQKIVDLTADEYGQLTFHLENGTTIAHTINYGNQLFIRNESIAPEKAPAHPITTTPGSPLPKPWWAWLQKFFGND